MRFQTILCFNGLVTQVYIEQNFEFTPDASRVSSSTVDMELFEAMERTTPRWLHPSEVAFLTRLGLTGDLRSQSIYV